MFFSISDHDIGLAATSRDNDLTCILCLHSSKCTLLMGAELHVFRINEYNIKQKTKSRGRGQLSWCHIPFIRWYNCFNYMFNIFDAINYNFLSRCESINFFLVAKIQSSDLCSSNNLPIFVFSRVNPKVNTSRWISYLPLFTTIIHKHIWRTHVIAKVFSCPSSFGTS